MDQVEAVKDLLRDNPAYSRLKKINLCEVCQHGSLIPKYILCLRNSELNSGICVECEDFELDTHIFMYDHKFRCRLCAHSTYMEKDENCKGLFCTYSKMEHATPVWISEVKAHSCTNFKFISES